MNKFNYRTLRDSVLLVMAYYQNFESAKPYIPEGMAEENPMQGQLKTVIKLEQVILAIDLQSTTQQAKFEQLIQALREISAGFAPDSTVNFFARGSRLHKLLVHLASIEIDKAYDLNEFARIFGLRFFHSEKQLDNKFRNLYIADAFMRELSLISEDDATLLDAVKRFRADYVAATHNMSYVNFVSGIKGLASADTPQPQITCLETFFTFSSPHKVKASGAGAGAAAEEAEEADDADERQCLVM